MVGGITFQMFVIVLFTILSLEYFVRYYLDKPVREQWNRLDSGSTSSVTGMMEHRQTLEKFRGEMTTKKTIMSCAFAFTTTLLFIR